MVIILDLLEELTVKYLIGAIPEGFSSTLCKCHSIHRFYGSYFSLAGYVLLINCVR